MLESEQMVRQVIFAWYGLGEYTDAKWPAFLDGLSRLEWRLDELRGRALRVLKAIEGSK